MHQQRTTLLAALFAAFLIWTSPLHAALSVTFTSSGLTVSGATEGDSIIIKGAARVPLGYVVQVRLFYDQLTAGSDGTVTFTADIPRKSAWVAVDQTTKDYVVAFPTGSPGSLAQSPVNPIQTDSGSAHNHVSFASDLADVLVVQADGNVWTALIPEGGATDGDGTGNGEIDILLGNLDRIGGVAPLSAPVTFQIGDVVVLIDTDDLAVEAFQVVNQ